MSTLPVVPAPAPAEAAPAPKKSSIQLLEDEVSKWVREKEQMIENVKTINGAIQGAQRMLAILHAEEEKAAAEAKKLIAEAGTEAKKIEGEVEAIAEKIEAKL